MKAELNRIRIAPKKANVVAGMVRNKKVEEALSMLKFIPNKAAKILYKVVKSAASNAQHNLHQDIKELYIRSLLVNKGPTLKRFVAAAKGRAKPIAKRSSNITVELGVLTAKKGASEKAAQTEASVQEEPVAKAPKTTKPAAKKPAAKKPVAKKAAPKKTA